MADLGHKEIFIVKRHAGHHDAHHGGAWKIAFADFMTAMMALFLVLWLISSTSEKTKQTVAQYFNPVKLVDMSTLKKGFRDPKETELGSGSSPREPQVESESRKPKSSAPTEEVSKPHSGSKEPAEKEAALFQDPYAVLSKLAARAPARAAKPPSPSTPSAASSDAGGEFSDPFAAEPQAAGSTTRIAMLAAQTGEAAPGQKVAAQSVAEAEEVLGAVQPLDKDANPLRRVNDLSKPAQETPDPGASEAAKLQAKILETLNSGAQTRVHPRIEVQETPEGLLISLIDDAKFSMFAVGSAEPRPELIHAMDKVGQLLKAGSGSIIIRGHTDGRPYKSRIYDNWRLSSARAQMALYMLTRGGVSEKRIAKVEGYADHNLKAPNNPNAAENRRIEILLRKDAP